MHALDYASEAKDIFVLPDSVIKVRKLIDDDSSCMDDIASVINFDPALTVQILKIANSALYKFPNKIETVSKAIQVIGTNSVYDLVVAFSICKTFAELDSSVIDLERYWENAVCCALLCKYFAERKKLRESERIFVSGLLHNVGELIMIRFNPDIAKQCAQINENETPLELQLKLLGGASYADIGSTLVKMWGIPEAIIAPIRNQHFSQHEATDVEQQIMQLSYILALDNCNPEIYSGHANLEVELYEKLGLEDSDLDAALSHVGMQSLSVLAMFNPAAASVM
ncbi:HDOD domain-containing protein [Aliiglaciecola sp. 3_MG-2023]|uniref:HDOD domain-containing protein n=1 Tax=Aliiglaciecola sp. 3_MG-2023 TaxID=3062644 RepID=UPI0026E2EE66|nr:HDOD domain-containing protein [Aliiglaciecola sp. 3_MG-2023]MDO6693383.1 HDOD domain-containing protein [Aliiglaciecola sp. 3_MG-2023]